MKSASGEQYASANSVASESFDAIRTVTALNAQNYFIALHNKYITDAMMVRILPDMPLHMCSYSPVLFL
jgi:hypothetical protein